MGRRWPLEADLMFGPGTLRTRLGELARARRAVAMPVPPATESHANGNSASALDGWPDASDAPPRFVPDRQGSVASAFAVGVETFLPGGEWRDERGAVYVHERLRSDVEHPRPHWGRLDMPPEEEPDLVAAQSLGLGRALFLDLETGGFSSSPVFLAGTMHWNGSDFVLRQYFARHYGEEACLLRALAAGLAGFETLVTFNGKSYDVPFLRDRARLHRVALPLPLRHLDLLHPARRRWRRLLPDCRLQTLERWVCRRRRAGDVPSDEVPGLYHDFVRRGDPYRLIPVFHHNLLDVITMADVLRALCGPIREPSVR
ncbi:MAG TPA: ribonuclease H-like domain-containing protein [Candidatus Limnocylindria bacterium]|nr:ribonuclease H-like domain-containing protein [Candidatus Limnocylindria bacterium]